MSRLICCIFKWKDNKAFNKNFIKCHMQVKENPEPLLFQNKECMV